MTTLTQPAHCHRASIARLRSTLALLAAGIAVTGATTLAFAPRAHSIDLIEVIDFQPRKALVPGEALTCALTLSGTAGATTPVHIYSEPAGAVTFDGVITTTGSTATVTATTSPDVDAGSVTIYVTTDGNQVLGTDVLVSAPASGDVRR
jgi:hypothetical protein